MDVFCRTVYFIFAFVKKTMPSRGAVSRYFWWVSAFFTCYFLIKYLYRCLHIFFLKYPYFISDTFKQILPMSAVEITLSNELMTSRFFFSIHFRAEFSKLKTFHNTLTVFLAYFGLFIVKKRIESKWLLIIRFENLKTMNRILKICPNFFLYLCDNDI